MGIAKVDNTFAIRSQLQRQVEALASIKDLPFALPLVLRFPVEPLDLPAWLAAKGSTPHFYFQARTLEWEIAGTGRYPLYTTSSISLADWYLLQEQHPAAEHLRLFFCRNFFSDETWNEFSHLQNVLPTVYLERIGQEYFETHLIENNNLESADSLIQRLEEEHKRTREKAVTHTPFLPELTDRIDTPNYAGWERGVEQVLKAISAEQVEKVVLARQTSFTSRKPFSALDLLSAVRNVQQDVYHFAYAPKAGHTLVGASPERLFQLHSGQVKTEAIAGTVGHQDDESIASLFSKKNLHEHDCVVVGIKKRLEKFAKNIVSDSEPAPLTLADMTHLRTKLAANLSKPTSIEEILAALHPTAAVCGTPEEAAAELIDNIEQFPRGLYAGPIGLLRGSDAECAVNLRCSLVQGERVSFYTGAGIVDGSNAASEWRELETKMATLIKLFHESVH